MRWTPRPETSCGVIKPAPVIAEGQPRMLLTDGSTSPHPRDGMFRWWEARLWLCFQTRTGGWDRRWLYLRCRRDPDEIPRCDVPPGCVLLGAESDKAGRTGVCEILRHGILPRSEGRIERRSSSGGPGLQSDVHQ